MGKLTALQVKNAKPGRHGDGKGLYLLVKDTGARSWVLRVVVNGRRRDFGLGAVATDQRRPVGEGIELSQKKILTLEEARKKAEDGRAHAKAGRDPTVEWKRAGETAPTFEQAARRYHGEVKKGWKNGKHRDQWLSTLETYAFPTIGQRPVSDIDADAIQSVLLPIWLTKAETARRVRQRIGTVLDFSKGKGWRDTEAPMRAVNSLMRGIKQPRGGNFAAMPYKELPALVTRLRDGAASVGRYALLFTILTAARSGEVRGARWREIDLEAAEWKIPPDRMKRERLHIVPLIPAAMDILREMRGLFGVEPDDLIFPGLKGKALSDATLAKALRVNGGGDYTVHGFRSTFRDWAADSGFADAWAEAALAHGNPDKTEAAYKRTTYFEQRRDKLMLAWGRYALSDGSNVISLAEARA